MPRIRTRTPGSPSRVGSPPRKKAKAVLKKGKKKLASTESIIAAVEDATGMSHAEMACPLVKGLTHLNRCILFYSLRWFGGWTQKRICESYGVLPRSVTLAQRKIHLMVSRERGKNFSAAMKDCIEEVRFTCRTMYYMEKED